MEDSPGTAQMNTGLRRIDSAHAAGQCSDKLRQASPKELASLVSVTEEILKEHFECRKSTVGLVCCLLPSLTL